MLSTYHAHYILRLVIFSTSVKLVVVQSLHITFLIHNEQFAMVSKSMH